MSTATLDALLRIKHARERRAAAALEQARAAEQEAAAQREKAETVRRSFGVLRRVQEGDIYRGLEQGPLRAGRLVDATMMIAELGARDGQLAERVHGAEQVQRERADEQRAAWRAHAAALRGREKLDALRASLAKEARREAERAQDFASEELQIPQTGRRP
jgi:hypothetical protein